MNKVLMVTVLLFTITVSLFCQELGDVNYDGEVDIIDALLVAQYYVGIMPPVFILYPADVNYDGEIDIVDALLISQYYVGLIPELPPVDCIYCEVPTPPPGYTPAPTSVPTPAGGTPAPSAPPRPGLFTLYTSKEVVKVCETFTTTAYVHTDTYVLTSYQVTFSYDYPVIQLRDCVHYNGVAAGNDGFVTLVDKTTPGTLVISGYDAAGTGPGLMLQMFVVYWKALPFETTEYDDYRSSYVSMTVDSILDDSGQPFEFSGVDKRYGPIIVYTGDNPPPSPW